MHIFVKQQIRQHTSFGGARNDNVIQWLQDTEAIFDRVKLQSMNKYIVVQQYLVGTTDKWFRLNENVIEDSTVVNIPNNSSSIFTSNQFTCSSTVAIDNPTTCEAELQELPNDQVNSYSSNDFHVVLNELSSVTESEKVNTRVNSDNANVGTCFSCCHISNDIREISDSEECC
ncbi:unnamed protein product [Rotaria magnacalcarata]|uniref:Uncharacterized protein n=2 Tax=Rotaria magnacalcarata TaxID=392030 RepID=A0A819U7J8_9BILA|nr:unnamed protein product [Rotaria magnacalcarata]